MQRSTVMTTILRHHVVLLGCLLHSVCVFGAESAAKTPRYFRHDAGVAAEGSAPLPARLDVGAHLRWREPMDPGHSTPLLWGDKIFLTSFRAAQQELATVALDRETGRRLWRRVAPARRIETFHPATGSPAAPTPACDGERLVVFFGSCGLFCYDLEGTLLWEHPLGPFQDEFGTGSSPILVENKVILNRDQDINSFLIALDAAPHASWKSASPLRSDTHAGRGPQSRPAASFHSSTPSTVPPWPFLKTVPTSKIRRPSLERLAWYAS